MIGYYYLSLLSPAQSHKATQITDDKVLCIRDFSYKKRLCSNGG